MRTIQHGGTAILLLLLCTNPARAQDDNTRKGFWFGFGFGFGSANISCAGCVSGSRIDGTSGFLRIGGTLRPNLRIGASFDGWSHSASASGTSGNVTETLGNLTASLYYYPRIRSGLFLEGGAGLSTYRLDTNPQVTGTGWGLTGGVGYEARLSRTVSLTPRAAYSWGSVGNVKSSDGTPFATQWKQDLFSIGVGLTFH